MGNSWYYVLNDARLNHGCIDAFHCNDLTKFHSIPLFYRDNNLCTVCLTYDHREFSKIPMIHMDRIPLSGAL